MRHERKRPHHATGLTTRTSAPDPREGKRREEIARRAYEIYLARGGGEGRDVEDWLRAEAEVLARKASR